jgi:hypothetical protein
MKQSIKKFLEFKGKNLLFLSKDGIYWIAIKPVCEAIGVEYTRSFKNLKEDPILGPALAIQPMQVPGDQVRDYSCLPEKFIYGWLFSIKSESQALLEYKKECYEILFDFFHGAITGREELIRQKAMITHELDGLETKLNELEDYKKVGNLRAEIARIGKSMKEIDQNEFNNQYDLFHQS